MSVASRTGSGACPTFFRALCRNATDGTTGEYQNVGYSFIGAVASMLAEDGEDQADAKLGQLSDLVWARDDDGTLAWFDREFPRCMALIPTRRRHQFLAGVYKRAIDEEANVFVY